MSQFNLLVEYLQGKDNFVADALSRFAYLASSNREDVSFHGSATAHAEVTKLLEEEAAESRMMQFIRLGRTQNFNGTPTPGVPVFVLSLAKLPRNLPFQPMSKW